MYRDESKHGHGQSAEHSHGSHRPSPSMQLTTTCTQRERERKKATTTEYEERHAHRNAARYADAQPERSNTETTFERHARRAPKKGGGAGMKKVPRVPRLSLASAMLHCSALGSALRQTDRLLAWATLPRGPPRVRVGKRGQSR